MTDTITTCITHGRAGRVSTRKVLPGITLCVAESQEPLYREHYPDDDYLVHPDTVVGISPKRQWLLDRYDGANVMMIDDDILEFRDVSSPISPVPTVDDAGTILGIIERTFDMAEEMGAFLIGFSGYPDPAMFKPQRPFRLVGMISGHAIGFRPGSQLWFPDTTELLTDDLYISALNAYHHRFMFQDQRYCFVNKDTWINQGGMTSHRTVSRMEANRQNMIDLFGPAIIQRRTTTRSMGKTALQLQLRVPW